VALFVLFYALPVAVLIWLPFVDAGLPRVRLFLGWVGTFVGVVGSAVVAGFYFFLAIGWDAKGSSGVIFAAAIGVVVVLAGGVVAFFVGRAQRRVALRTSAELRG
jgi:hypothetical protein